MNCPKCAGLFIKVTFQDIQVDRCKTCHGLWFDEMELKDLLKKKGSQQIDVGNERHFQKTSRIEDYLCPKDGARMIKMADPRQPHVWYEACGHCKGIFLDATEYKDLKEQSLLDVFKSLTTPERKA